MKCEDKEEYEKWNSILQDVMSANDHEMKREVEKISNVNAYEKVAEIMTGVKSPPKELPDRVKES